MGIFSNSACIRLVGFAKKARSGFSSGLGSLRITDQILNQMRVARQSENSLRPRLLRMNSRQAIRLSRLAPGRGFDRGRRRLLHDGGPRFGTKTAARPEPVGEGVRLAVLQQDGGEGGAQLFEAHPAHQLSSVG